MNKLSETHNLAHLAVAELRRERSDARGVRVPEEIRLRPGAQSDATATLNQGAILDFSRATGQTLTLVLKP